MYLKPNLDLESQPGCEGSLGTVKNMIFDPDGIHALQTRISKIKDQQPAMLIYVFGHTHEAKVGMLVKLYNEWTIKAFIHDDIIICASCLFLLALTLAWCSLVRNCMRRCV